MIKLENIKQKDNIISATVTTVEMNPITFEVAINTVTKEIVKNTLGRMTMSSSMAVAKLFKLSEDSSGKIPETSESVWY